MSVRKLSSPAIEAIRPKEADPLTESIFGSKINTERVPWLKKDPTPVSDFRSSMAIFRIGRMINENFSSMGEYIANLMAEFEHPRSCGVYLMHKNTDPNELEHRLSVYWGDDAFGIDESTDPIIGSKIKSLLLSSFQSKTPILFNGDLKIKMVFDNLDMNDYSCSVYPFEKGDINLENGSLAIMPFHYRDPVNPSGVVLFDGDLRCRGSSLDGLNANFWTATATMEAASLISFMLTHKFDAITILTRIQDFKADFNLGVKQLINNEIPNMYMVMLDIDNFKMVNTKYGWRGGNEVLRRVAETIKKSVRLDDTVSRIGGEEFGVILRNLASKEEAIAIAERIRRNIEETKIQLQNQEARVTCSIGVTRIDEIANRAIVFGNFQHFDNSLLDSIYDLSVKFSEEGVSSAKNSGKNRVYFNTADSLL